MNEKPAKRKKKEKLLVGWKEWCALPQFDISKIAAKIDTGAKTSCLHAEAIKVVEKRGIEFIQFKILPHRNDNYGAKICLAKLSDYRFVTSSNGEREKRYVIETPLVIGSTVFTTEITLTDRTLLNFRMLIGRAALEKKFIVDVARSHLQKLPELKR